MSAADQDPRTTTHGVPPEARAALPDGPDAGSEPSAPTAQPAGPPATAAEVDASEYRVDPATVRHAPRFGRFILLGVVLGALLSLALALLTPPSDLARSDLFWLLFIGLGVTGGLAGLGVAIVLDRRSWRRRAAPGALDTPTRDVPAAGEAPPAARS
ncbi:hypothetical protein FE374_16950 [Georgenia yuyongxinii]|uniref:DUF2530 domain-containing protein n=1 Tax=Georgenia yuyongxinii TaxID=2589797 RepID=A0A5B8C6A4_9MICO|nr:hypothetical protein [Georgenia yuyongxinii]QDC26073.1 hypothetical protein FE374_16950 [Georgenia yuyongxinii]